LAYFVMNQPMRADRPHFLLFTEGVRESGDDRQWRFVLQPTGDGSRVVESDIEPEATGSRLELLAVVRGLESLEQPSQVTLLTASRFVRRGICQDLAQWRQRGWVWECFGKLVPIRDQDLWQRIDRALAIHTVECLQWQGARQNNSNEQAAMSAELGDATVITANTTDEPAVVIVPRKSTLRVRPAQSNAAGRKRRNTAWGQELVAAVAGLGQPALSRTA
jgi:ribonuclease HI